MYINIYLVTRNQPTNNNSKIYPQKLDYTPKTNENGDNCKLIGYRICRYIRIWENNLWMANLFRIFFFFFFYNRKYKYTYVKKKKNRKNYNSDT